MYKIGLVITAFLMMVAINSCNKKTHPSATNNNAATETKVVKSNTIKTAIPKVITVNDKVAKRSVDGRYYYDLEGHRYWRNNKDGKYYLFHKSMFDDEAFKSPARQ